MKLHAQYKIDYLKLTKTTWISCQCIVHNIISKNPLQGKINILAGLAKFIVLFKIPILYFHTSYNVQYKRGQGQTIGCTQNSLPLETAYQISIIINNNTINSDH